MTTFDESAQIPNNVTRRWLLKSSAKLTAGAVAICGTAAQVPVVAAAIEDSTQMTEEMARHFTTF